MENASLLIILTLLTGCAGVTPSFDGKIWAGDSKTGSIQRAQDNEAISALDPRFNGYFCMSGADLEKFYKTFVLGCAKWKDGIKMTTEQEEQSWINLLLQSQ